MKRVMRIALTGATGFVGSAVLDEALRQGHTVAALTRRPQPAREGVRWIEGTLEDPEAIDDLLDAADVTIHVAGLTNAPDPAAFEKANVEGTRTIVDIANAREVSRLVLVSSLSAREPKLSAYGASKAKAEAIVNDDRTLNSIIVRPPAVYGPRDVDMFELFRSARYGLVPLPPRGATSIIHVHDLARLLVNLAEPNQLNGRVFEPDDGRVGGYSHKELGQAIGRAVGRRSVLAVNLPKDVLKLAAKADKLLRGDKAKLTADRVGYMLHPNWIARSDRAVPADVWTPEIDGEAGLKSTAEWYEQEGWL